MCLAQGPQRSDAGEARTRGPSVSSQALYHWAKQGRTAMVLPAGCPHSVEVDNKSQSPCWSLGLEVGGGQWLQMTIVHNNYYKQLRLGSNKIYIYRLC